MLTAMQTGMAQSKVTPGPFGMPSEGTARLYVSQGSAPSSLRQLCDFSTLIVEGVVKTSLLPRLLSPNNPETDAVISVSRTLKGADPNPDIVVAQLGGTIGKFTSKPVQYSIMQPNETYLLFLKEDTRPIPQISGTKRYLVTGVWSGLFFFNAGKMVVAAGPDALRKRYDGLSEDQVISLVTDAIKHKDPPEPIPSPFSGAVAKP
jgi:hypothetical protein